MAHDFPPQLEASVGPDLIFAGRSRRNQRKLLMIGGAGADHGRPGGHRRPDLRTFATPIVEEDQSAADKFNVLRLAERAGEGVGDIHDRTRFTSWVGQSGRSGRELSNPGLSGGSGASTRVHAVASISTAPVIARSRESR